MQQPQRLCRICYEEEGERDEELISPCSCSGSLKFVHASCMNQWRLLNMNNENRTRCQLCMEEFRLTAASTSRLSAEQEKRLADAGITLFSALAVVPLSFGALHISRFAKREENLYVSGPADVSAKPWRKQAFGMILSKSILEDINLFILGAPRKALSKKALFIYGLAKLGGYGCTFWLFSDGLSKIFPIHIRRPNGDRRPSPFLAILKAIVEFYVIPYCLRTPQTRMKLPFFVFTTLIGIYFIFRRIEIRLRQFLLGFLPVFKELELGQLASS